eukprot:COSAG01_NODE_320_length_18904_cov_45.662537_1_plen_109_part_00
MVVDDLFLMLNSLVQFLPFDYVSKYFLKALDKPFTRTTDRPIGTAAAKVAVVWWGGLARCMCAVCRVPAGCDMYCRPPCNRHIWLARTAVHTACKRQCERHGTRLYSL